MCSVSWKWDGEGNRRENLTIYFSRDERKSRPGGLPPQPFESEHRKILYPVDPEKGGTWLAANDCGLVVGLLNNYREKHAPAKSGKSRGNLVKHVAKAGGIDQAGSILETEIKGTPYPAFTLLVWHQSKVRKWEWLENQLHFDPDPTPLVTSSSWETERVEHWRQESYRKKVVAGGWSPERFHRWEREGDEASSICMMRQHTQTVSLTICKVSAQEVVMEYFSRDLQGHFGERQGSSLALFPE